MSDFLTPEEISEKNIAIAEKKTSNPAIVTILLGILGGAYISIGSILYLLATHDLANFTGIGFSKIFGGAVFSLGLMLVVIAGAELFTGNTLIFGGVIAKKVKISAMLKNWTIVYFTNFAGALLVAILIFLSHIWTYNGNLLGEFAIKVALSKLNLSFTQALIKGILCNWLVCLGVWLAIAGKDIVSKIWGIFFPVMAFVALGFEHCVANMFFIPFAMMLSKTPEYVTMITPGLSTGHFIIGNLIPVTIGNIIGGSIFVAGIYGIAFMKKSQKDKNKA